MNGYRPVSRPQEAVMHFARYRKSKQKIQGSEEEISKYIGYSKYWEKKSVTVKNELGHKIKFVFAENPDIKAIIFRYDADFIITTESSFENYLRGIEGKKPKGKKWYKIS